MIDIEETRRIIRKLDDVQVEIQTKSKQRSTGSIYSVYEEYCVLRVGTGRYELFHYWEIESVTVLFQ